MVQSDIPLSVMAGSSWLIENEMGKERVLWVMEEWFCYFGSAGPWVSPPSLGFPRNDKQKVWRDFGGNVELEFNSFYLSTDVD